MTALTRPIRRLLGRRAAPDSRRRSLAVAPSRRADVAQAEPVRSQSTSPRPTRSSPTSRRRPGRSTSRRLELDSPAVTALRAAGVALVVPLVSQGELIGTLNLGPAPVRAGLLDRRPPPPDDPRGPGRAGHPRRPARPRAGRTRQPNASASSRRCGSRPSSSSNSCRASCRTCRNGRSPPTTARRARSAATSTTSSRCPTGGSASPSATSPTRACRRPSSWPGPTRSCAPRPAGATPRATILARANELLAAGDAGPDVRHLPVRDPRARRPGASSWPTPATTCPTSGRTTGVVELRATGMPLGLMPGHRLRGDRGRHRSGQQRPALLGRPRRGPRPDGGDVRLPAAARGA